MRLESITANPPAVIYARHYPQGPRLELRADNLDDRINLGLRKRLLTYDDTKLVKLKSQLRLVVGSRVVLVSNIAPRNGLYNGLGGEVIGFCYKQSEPVYSNLESSPDPLTAASILDPQIPVLLMKIDEKHWLKYQQMKPKPTDLPKIPGMDMDRVIAVAPIEEEIKVRGKKWTRIQLPVIPADSLTISKAQGITRNHITFDARDKYSWARSLVYVALSRVTDLAGLTIVGRPLTAADFSHRMDTQGDLVREEYTRLRRLEGNTINAACVHVRRTWPDFEWDPNVGDP